MSDAAQTGSEPEESPLSPWWIRSIMIVMVVGLAGLITITLLAYRNAPPIPARIVDASGVSLFTGEDISNGQALFLRYGLMDNGTIWGHGAYLGPDYSAEALHRIGETTAANHGHAALMGVFGMLALAMMVFVLRQTTDETRWARMEKYVKVGFWGTNVGLFMMITMNLFPGGVLQVWDVVEHGYWHARSLAYTGSATARLIEWLRLPGDLVFIIFGAVPLAIAATKGYIGVRATRIGA